MIRQFTLSPWPFGFIAFPRTRHQFILQTVQPALAGFMVGSVTTHAPLFATSLATRDSHTTFVVGLAAWLGA